MKAPTEEKFRTLKTTNKVIAEKLFSLKGGINELIIELGYIKADKEHFVFLGDYFKVLQLGTDMTE